MNALTEKLVKENNSVERPRLVLAHADPVYAKSVGRYYRSLGWETHVADTGTEARRLARDHGPAIVVLGTNLPDESGWLTCDKMLDENPDQKVVLVSRGSTPNDRRFARFVGASALVHEQAGVQALAEHIGGPMTLAAM